MRKIKFRGKRTDNEEWVYGNFYKGHRYDAKVSLNGIRIFWNIVTKTGEIYEVYHDSVGQYVDFNDKNGKKIYEGDLLKSKEWACNCEVIFEGGGFTLKEGESSENLESNLQDSDGYQLSDVEIIGNIHKNTELLAC